MCSLGHREDRPQRRHTDGSVTAAVRKIPRAELVARRLARTAQLRDELEAEEADRIAASFGMVDAEPLERGAEIQILPGLGDDNDDKESRRQERSRAFRMHGALE